TFREFGPIMVEVRDGDDRIGWGEGLSSPGPSSSAFCRERAAAIVGMDIAEAKSIVCCPWSYRQSRARALQTALEMLEGAFVAADWPREVVTSRPLIDRATSTHAHQAPRS